MTNNIIFDNKAFTLNLLNGVLKEENKSKNIIISPLSIQTCLGLAFIGAEGKTAEELSTGLRLGTLDREEVASSINQLITRPEISALIKIVNKLYLQNDVKIKSDFNRIVTENFHSTVDNIDFKKSDEAAQIINSWVEEHTNNKIQNLIQSSSLRDARVLLINAIYFKGKWKNQFNVEITRKEKFWNDENNAVEVDMMFIKNDFKYGDFSFYLNAKAIQLPYANSDLKMLIIVPNEKTGLPELEKKLEEFNILELEKDMFTVKVSLDLPKFKSEFSVNLNEILKKMGMVTMFTDNAEFPHLAEEKFRIDKVFHKAVIEVDEDGTEAAAATYVEMVTVLCALPQTINLTVDRPFLYFIKDEKVTYFMGRVSKF